MRRIIPASRHLLLPVLYALCALVLPLWAAPYTVTPVPEAERQRLNLDPFYQKYCSAQGFPILASEKVSDYALLEAAWLMDQMLSHRPDVRQALIDSGIRFAIMAVDEFTLDVPEHRNLRPKAYWPKRARGIGASDDKPAVSCGEENLLELSGDPYATESIFVHEFAHAIHLQGMAGADPTFDDRLRKSYERARARGLWGGTSYAGTNKEEYWAEGVQSWFECNRANDNQHNDIDTRAELKGYDPGLAALLEEVFGDTPWTYTKPTKREDPQELAHLAGFDRGVAPEFVWPEEIVAAYEAYQRGEGLSKLDPLPASSLEDVKSGAGSSPSFLRVVNQTEDPVEVFWVDFQGERKSYGKIGAGQDWDQTTYDSHAWAITDGEGKVLGVYQATKEDSLVELK